MKILFFEGAGMDYEINQMSNIGNYRIRTAFKNNDGIQYYIELGRGVKPIKKNGKYYIDGEWALYINHLFKLEDRFKLGLEHGAYELSGNYVTNTHFEYTKEDITKWINENLNCDFDSIEVLDMFYGYRVHADNGCYNLIDNHLVNHELALKRREAYTAVDAEYRWSTNSKYSVISLLEMDDNSITIKCHASEKALGRLPRIKKVSIE